MKLTIEKVIYGGQGLARIPEGSGPRSGMRIFAPFTLPEEIVEAEIAQEHRGYCVGEVRRIEKPSEFRISPRCPWFGQCGGCQLQHSNYSLQLEMKREMLAESLMRAGVRELPLIDILSGTPFEYRNRVRLQVQTQPEFAIGYRQARSHRITAIDRCPIAMPLLQRCIASILSFASRKLVPLDIQEIEIFTNHDQSALLLTAWIRNNSSFEPKLYSGFFTKLQQELSELTGAAVFAGGKEPSPGVRPLLQWCRQELNYRVAEREYIVGIESFFQINSTLVDAFVHAATEVGGGKQAWDLYAGVGLFSSALTERFDEIVAVESNPSACNDLRQNLKAPSSNVVQSTTLHYLEKSVSKISRRSHAAPDLVLLDPPRVGAGTEVCQMLAHCSPQRIVYVSCDPATLGRDLTALIQSGYRLQRLQLVDMFPQTSHLETIAMLER